MIPLCIVAKNFETYFIRRLIEEVGKDDVELLNPWDSSELPLSKTILVRTSGVYRDDLDLEFLNNLPSDFRVLNSPLSLKRFREKGKQYEFLKSVGIPHIPWLNLNHAKDQDIEAFLNQLSHKNVLIKPQRGQGGWGIRTFEKSSFLENFRDYQQKEDLDYVLQPYVTTKKEGRLFFIGTHFKVSLQRENSSGLQANFAQGGEAAMMTPSKEMLSVLNTLIKKSGVHYGAIDFFYDEKELLILELNTCPGIEQLEAVSGENILKLLLGSLS